MCVRECKRDREGANWKGTKKEKNTECGGVIIVSHCGRRMCV